MSRRFGPILACVTILAAGMAQGAPTWKWTLLNPLDGAEILSMATGEGILLASTRVRGVFRSVDTARTWHPLGAEAFRMFSLEYDSASHRFYGLGDSGLYAADAQAREWIKLTDFPADRYGGLDQFFIGNTQSRFSVHGRLIILLNPTSETVRVSRDGGSTWRSTSYPYFSPVLAVDSCVYISGPLSESCDGGATWALLGGKSPKYNTYNLARYQGGLLMATDSGFFGSNDRGRTWVPRNGKLPEIVLSGQSELKGLQTNGNSFYALIYENVGNWGRYTIHRSRDGGSSWSALGETEYDPRAPVPTRPSLEIVEVGSRHFRPTTRGIAVSVDDGITWSRVRGLGDAETLSLAVQGRHFLALTGKGLFVSADSGATWEAALRNDTTATWTTLSGGLGRYALLSRQGGVRVSTDSGATWKAVLLPAPGPAYALTLLGRNLYLLAAGGLWRSGVEGSAWTEIPLPAADSLRLMAGGTRSLLLCGRTHVWEYNEDGGFLDRKGSFATFDITGASMVGEAGYVVNDGRLHVWEAANGDWRPITTLGDNGYPYTLAGRGSNLVIYSLWSPQISVDGGRSWEVTPVSTAAWMPSISPTWLLPFTFALDGGQVYAGDPTGGIWKLDPGFSDSFTGIREKARRPSMGREATGLLNLLEARKIRLDGRALLDGRAF
ncbi:MAG: sialidase family protein [Fibrobacteria bacterium]